MGLQILASLGAAAFTADVSSAFGQTIKGQRRSEGAERLFATPPKEGIPGEEDDILIEILSEIYGLVSGPPGWRQTLLTEFKGLTFSRHPLAPCVVLMYECLHGEEKPSLSGLIIIETDDLLGGGSDQNFMMRSRSCVRGSNLDHGTTSPTAKDNMAAGRSGKCPTKDSPLT